MTLLPAQALERYGDALAWIMPDGRRGSYRQLAAAADAAALAFGSRRTLVAVLSANHVESLVGFLGAQRAGHAVLLLDGGGHPASIAALLGVFRPAWVWKTQADGHFGAEALPNPVPSLHPDLTLLLPTSGSTGTPKVVRLSSAAVGANASAIAETLPCGAGERAMMTLPMHYAYGLSVVHSFLHAGGALLLTPDGVMSPSFWAFLKSEEATTLSGVPYTYEMLRKLGADRRPMGAVRTFTQAGGRMDPTQTAHWAARAEAWGAQWFTMYGQTEATARMACLPSARWRDKLGSAGRAIPGGKLSIEDGEVIYRGPNVAMGYAESADDLSVGDGWNGVLRTGDIGRLDGDGFLWIEGRRNRFIKLYGQRIGLDELEQALGGLGFTCACGGVDGRLQVAVQGHSAARMLAVLGDRFRIHADDVQVSSVEALPRSSHGKIRYGDLFSTQDPR